MKSISIKKFGVFAEPTEIKWSSFHNLFVVMGRQTLYTYNKETEEQKVIYSSDSNEFVNMDVSVEGYLVVAMKEILSGNYSVKLFAPNLFSLAHTMTAGGRTVRKVLFVSGKIPLVASDSAAVDPGNNAWAYTVFSLLQPYGDEITWMPEEYSANGLGTMGHVVSITRDETSNVIFSITSGGEVWVLSGGETGVSSYSLTLGGNIGAGASIASGGLSHFLESNAPQEKLRVYVGSAEWRNDMWDSGEVESALSTIPYGGGDNLKPGHRYWVHIMTYHSDSGWSSPQIKSFVMPKE